MTEPSPTRLADAIRFLAIDAIVRAGEGHQGVPLGMAEIATNVIHNVGNVLNSVNVSAGVVAENVRKPRAESLARVVALLKGHEHDLGEFLTSDPKDVRALLAASGTRASVVRV